MLSVSRFPIQKLAIPDTNDLLARHHVPAEQIAQD